MNDSNFKYKNQNSLKKKKQIVVTKLFFSIIKSLQKNDHKMINFFLIFNYHLNDTALWP
jgi:hypothetical protein